MVRCRKEKVYQVEFMRYSNYEHDCVSNASSFGDNPTEYLELGDEPFLIKESDLSKYQQFGGGYKSLIFVGNIEVLEDTEMKGE